ncbi:ParA family protein [Dokdonella fugitiva]|jgi:chromosome partitioning protein|uniref:ParA family protein n=1 Tax=Dokdonella fugitiva TaxID=328517 RepID=UPI0015FAB93C|nr:AAA family ATPase [Dokdonella fugitiva]MBA8884419.1 chromosome partitioning protein [Dokdonella fugitiva]
MSAIAVSLINMKGGVGKTTLATQLAHAAARRNLKTLAIDLDPQANLSQALLGAHRYVSHLNKKLPTVVNIFEQYVPPTVTAPSPGKVSMKDIIIQQVGYWSQTKLDLVPSRLELANTLKNPTGKERRLAKALSKISGDYDLILIDCAPTESILTEAAYHCSRYALVPVKPEFLATIGLPLLARSIAEFSEENGDHELDICGIVFNHSSSYSDGPESEASVLEVKLEAKKHSWHVYGTRVRYSRSYAKAAREAAPISSTSYVRSNVSAQFSVFANEFFKSIGI